MSVNYEVPDGWHRLAVSDDEEDPQFDPWFNFIQEIALRFTLERERTRKNCEDCLYVSVLMTTLTSMMLDW